MHDFLLYGCSFVIGVSLLFVFIKYCVSSIRSDIKKDIKEAELNNKFKELQTQINEQHKLQSDLNTKAQHVKLLKNNNNN